MSSKKHRREQALKKAKQKKLVRISVCVAIAAVIFAVIAFNIYQQGGSRVFTDEMQTVTLRGNGRFTAELFHGITRNGTYIEHVSDGVTTISFTERGVTVTGELLDDVLTIPAEWGVGCGHDHSRYLRLEP